MKNILVVFCCFFALSNAVHASIITNTSDDFKIATQNWKNLSDIEKTTNWDNFESKYQAIYDSRIYHKELTGWEDRQKRKRDFFFSQLPTIEKGMIDLFNNAETIVHEREQAFKKYFPDLKNDIPVIILPSLFSFNGQVASVPNSDKYGLYIGVDFIAYRNDNLNVLFAHEFFHAYHHDKLGEKSNGQTMATPLWKEGFATYVSGLLNPEQTDEVLLMDKDLTSKCNDNKYVADLAKLYLPILKTDGETTYGDWFLMSGQNPIKRRGYCLGLKVIREIVKVNTVLDMTTWDEARFSVEVENVLNNFLKENE